MICIKKQWPLLLSTTIVLLIVEQNGMISGWASPVLARLQSDDSPIPTTSDEGSWMATIMSVVGIFATPFAALSIEYFGRKISLLIATIPYIISWIILGMSTTVDQLIIGRSISGIGIAFSLSVVPIYLGEISTDDVRGVTSLYMTVFTNFGILWMYCFGMIPELWKVSLSAAAPLVLVIVFYYWLPESPYYLITKNRRDEAIKELKKLRNSNNVEEEIKQIEITAMEATNDNMFKEFIFDPTHRRALFVSLGTLTIAQCTGGIALIFYVHLIFQRAGDVDINLMSIIKAILQLITSIIAAYFVENLGRRPLLIISCIGSGIFMACEGIFFYLSDNGYNVDSISWLPLVAMILFNVFQSIGLTSISFTYFGELFHPKIKALAVCINKAYLSFLVVVVGKLFQIMTDYFGNSVPFFVFALVGVLGVFFVVFCVPETKGKSLDDIQYYFKNKTFKRNV